MGGECPECGVEYERLGQHWWGSPNHRPELTQHQKEIITGLIMGDGDIKMSNKNPRIRCRMVSPNYLEYLDDVFGCLSCGVRLERTAEESAKQQMRSRPNSNVSVEDYSDVYNWESRGLPKLEMFSDWYSSGKKVWPEDINLTPTVLKHWYCGDGNWDNTVCQNRIRIGMDKEVENTDKVNSYFENVNLPEPSNYYTYKYENGNVACSARWTVEDSKELWDYMGEPLPDFEYKWPERYHNS